MPSVFQWYRIHSTLFDWSVKGIRVLGNAYLMSWRTLHLRSVLNMPVEDRAFKVLSENAWGDDGTVVADLIAPFVYKC